MRRNRKGFRAAAITFLCGVAVTSFFKPKPPDGGAGAALSAAAPCPVAAPSPVGAVGWRGWGDTAEGMEWKNRNNGLPLRLDYEDLRALELSDVKVIPLSSGRILAAAADTLYMLDDWGHVAWKYSERQGLFDFAFVEATRMVYGTAGDNTMFILDVDTGRLLLRDSRNGRAGYGLVVPYGKDQCLVTDNFSGYRDTESFIPPMSDGVTAWRGTKMLWHQKFPPDAELQVSGDRIFAVTRTDSKILVTEIVAPKAGR